MTKMKSLCAVVLLCCSVSYGRANTIITNPGPGLVGMSSFDQNLGFDFTVGSTPLLVTALGLWDQNQDGFTNPHFVGLWDTSGNLLAKAFIAAGTVDPLSGQFRYATPLLGSVTLSAGTTYVLGAAYLQNDADLLIVNLGGNQATFDPAVTPGNARFSSGGFAFPNGNDGPGSYVGPNAQFTFVSNGVPDTGSTWMLLLLGVTATFGLKFFVRRSA